MLNSFHPFQGSDTFPGRRYLLFATMQNNSTHFSSVTAGKRGCAEGSAVSHLCDFPTRTVLLAELFWVSSTPHWQSQMLNSTSQSYSLKRVFGFLGYGEGKLTQQAADSRSCKFSWLLLQHPKNQLLSSSGIFINWHASIHKTVKDNVNWIGFAIFCRKKVASLWMVKKL